MVVGRGDHDRVERLLLLEHLPIVRIRLRARMVLERFPYTLLVRVAEGHDVVAADALEPRAVPAPHAAHADNAQVHRLVGRVPASQPRGQDGQLRLRPECSAITSAD